MPKDMQRLDRLIGSSFSRKQQRLKEQQSESSSCQRPLKKSNTIDSHKGRKQFDWRDRIMQD